MLLLGLAGVSEEDIIANYMVTQIYNKANPEETMMNLPIELPKELLESKPEFMIKVYHYLVEKYENVENYFLQIGIDKVILILSRKNLLHKVWEKRNFLRICFKINRSYLQ